ncbi:MAG: hydroxysqualene dehydroxylase HpnE [Acidobacteriota bacterium]
MAPVVVIGGGFSGLAAATALADAGLVVRLFEARPALGGRAATFRDPVTDEPIDNGQHVLAGCYVETLRFLRRIGTDRSLHRPSALRVPMIDERGRHSVLTLPPLPAPLNLLAGVLAWEAVSWPERLSILRLAGALRPLAPGSPAGLAAAGEAGETVRQWLVRHGQSPRLCRLLWEPLALATLNQSVDQAGASAFLAVITRMFGPEPDSSALLLPAVSLGDLYARPAAAYLQQRGSSVTTGAPARVVVEQGRVVGVRVREEMTPASVVIAAVPWFALRDVFDEVPRELETTVDDASRLDCSPIVTVNLWFDRDVMDEPFIGLPGRTFQWAFDRRRLTGPAASHISMVSSGAVAICAGANPDLIATAVRDLGSAIPAAQPSALRHASVVRERRATFSLAPGASRRPRTETPIPGLLLAGDWIDTGLPATIESAVLAGHRAAGAALD